MKFAHWREAISEEMEAMKKNQVYTWTHLPPGRTAVTSKFVFKTKFDSNGKIAKYKARLVARGFTQQYGLDYKDTYASVTRQETIRAALAIARNNNLDVNHIDVNTAFLHGDLDEEAYI